MKATCFFRREIVGDDLRPEELATKIPLACDIYHKGEESSTFLRRKIIQKTNRWVYKVENKNNEGKNVFLSR